MALSWNKQKDSKVLAWNEINPLKNRKVLPWNKETTDEMFFSETTRNLPTIKSLSPQVEKQIKEKEAKFEKSNFLTEAKRFLLPRELEVRYGITKPNYWEKIDKVESERMLYLREQHFKNLYEKEVIETPKISKDYKEPETYWGQFKEGIEKGTIASKSYLGYFFESIGRSSGLHNLMQYGKNIGDKATIEILKNPELFEPKDLKPFFEGGMFDPRWYGRRIGETMPHIAANITVATLGGLAFGPPGAYIGGFSYSAASMKGSSYKRYIDEGVPLDKADTYSSVYGTIAGAIENVMGLSPAKIGIGLTTKGTNRVVADSYKSFLFKEIPKIGTQTLKMSLIEGSEEVAQGITENLVLKFFKTETPVFTKDLVEEFAAGAVASLPFGATNIRIPEIKKTSLENAEKFGQLINNVDKSLQESDISVEDDKEIKKILLEEPKVEIKNIENLKPKEIKEQLRDGKVFKYEEGTENKVGSIVKGFDYKMWGTNPILTHLYGTGYATDSYVLIRDKKISEEIYAKWIEKDLDVHIRNLKKENPNITEETIKNHREVVKKNLIKTLTEEKEGPDVEKIISKEISKDVAIPQGYFFNESLKQSFISLSDGNKQVVVNADKFAFVKKKLPEASIRIIDEKSPVQFVQNGKISGLIMPINIENNPFPVSNKTIVSKELVKEPDLSQVEKVQRRNDAIQKLYASGEKFAKVPEPVKFPENKYKQELLEEINKAELLPRFDKNAFDWTPPTISYNNPYTRVMTKAWDKVSDVWDSKAPLVMKQFQSKEVGETIKERQRVYDGLIKKYYEEIVRPTTKLSKEEKENIGNMIFKRINIPEDYKETIKNIDLKIGQLGHAIVNIDKEMVANKQLKEKDSLLTEKTWKENLGEYARTLYVKVENGKTKIEARSEVTKNGVINRSAFKKKMTDEEWGANALNFEGKTIEEIEQYSLEELKEIGQTAKENYGWIVQADYILSRTFIDLTKSYTTRLFQKEIIENPRLFTNDFKTAEKMGFIPIRDILPKPLKIQIDDKFITVSQAKKLGPLAYGYIHPGLQDEIKTFVSPKEVDSVMSIFQGPLSWWKIFKVAANPATVTRNYISGAAIQTDLGGYPVWTSKNSKRYARALKSYTSKDSLYKELRDSGLYGSDYYSVEISQDEMSKIVNRAEKSNNSYQEYTDGLLNKLTEIVSETGNKLEDSKELFNYYAHIDHIQRTYMALCAKEDGATNAQAVHFANKWQLDYRFVPKFVDSLRSGLPGWLYPFLSFYTLMAPRIAETLVTRPWTLIKYPLIFAAINSISVAFLGTNDDEIENAKPEWLKENNYTLLLPDKDDDGNFVFLNLDYTLPFGGWKDGFMDIDQVLQMVKSPGIMSGVLGILNNYDFFTEKKIYNETDLDSVKRGKIVKYIIRNFGPGFVNHAMNIYSVSQGETTGFPIEKEKSLKVTIGKAVGISLYSGGFNQAYWKIHNIKSEISEIQWAMKLYMQDKDIPSKEKQEKLIEFREEIQTRQEKIQKISKNMPKQQSTSEKEKSKVIPHK